MIIETSSGIIGLWDSGSFTPPHSEPDRGFITALKRAAEQRDVFFIDAEDTVTYNVEVLVEQEVPPRIAQTCELRAGSFGLHVPTGRLHLGSIPTSLDGNEIAVPPGDYLVTPMAQRHFDVQWVDPLMRQFLGEKDWRYYNSVTRLSAFGCFAWILLAILMVIPATRRLWPIAVPLLLLPWFLFSLLSRLPRYRGIEQRQRLHEAELPHFVLMLRRSSAATDVPGGWTPGL